MNLGCNLRLVLNDPTQFRSCKISWRVEQMWQAIVLTKGLKCFFTKGYCPAVAPDDRWTKNLIFFIYAYQPMHLIGNSNGSQFTRSNLCLATHKSNCLLDMLPPKFRVLFCPATLRRLNGHFNFWKSFGGKCLSGIRIKNTCFDRRTSKIKA